MVTVFTTFFNRLWTGFALIFVNFQMVLRNLRLVFFSAPSTLWTFFMSPILFGLITKNNFFHIPPYVYIFAFSFIGLIIFNFIYLTLSFFQLHRLENKQTGLMACVRLTWQKINPVVLWAFISAALGTSLFHTSDIVAAHPDALSQLFFRGTELFWWLINFLLVPVFTTTTNVRQALSWTIKTIFLQPGIVLGAGGGLLLIKHYLSKLLFFQVVMRTPHLLYSMRVIEFTAVDRAFLIAILLPIVSFIVATCISIFMSAVEATLATSLYARFVGKAPEVERENFWGIFFMAMLVFIIFVLLAFSVATSLIMLSSATPELKANILAVLS